MAYSQFGRRDLYYPHHHHFRPGRRPTGNAGKFAALATILLLALWSGGVTFYLVFRDDALAYLARRQTDMVQNYDGQLTALETEIERLKSLKLVDQERVDRAVLDLGRRQMLVEQRQKELAKIAAPKSTARAAANEDVTGSIPPPKPLAPAAGAILKPSPISDTIILMPPPDRSAELESRPAAPQSARMAALETTNPTEMRIGELSRGLDRMQTRQAESLNRLEEAYEDAEARIRGVLGDLGVRVPPPSLAKRVLAIGGPLLPFISSEDPFEQQISRLRSNAGNVAELGQLLNRVPVRRPVPATAEITSGFGSRLDPFIKQYAFHSGVDLKGEPGDIVRATAAGRITNASYQGGYGLMVEIDHGNGLATRYGHLSAIDVTEGQVVEAGDAVGRIGTTGRSTGPHLHYEVRVAGEAIDPQRYLRAGLRLGTL